MTRFGRWVEVLDPDVRVALQESNVPWLITAASGFGLVFLAARAPGVRDFFQLSLVPGLIVAAPALFMGLIANRVDGHFELSNRTHAVLELITAALMLFFAAALVALSAMPGALLMCGIYLLMATYYGHHYRATWELPFGFFPLIVGTAAAYFIAPDAEHTALFAVAFPTALGSMWLTGSAAHRTQAVTKRGVALESAIHAQALAERVRDLDLLSTALARINENTHDLRNTLSSALIGVEVLSKSLRRQAMGQQPTEDPAELATELSGELGLLLRSLEERQDLTRAQDHDSPPRASVAPAPVIEAVTHSVQRGYRDVVVGVRAASTSPMVLMCGGRDTLHRVIENLVVNACQGDGRSRGTRVTVWIEEAPIVGAIAIHVDDNGPGFSSDQLDEPIAPLATTKASGMGLGLYTAERLVRASGGSLRRENRPGGGARVSLFLTEGAQA